MQKFGGIAKVREKFRVCLGKKNPVYLKGYHKLLLPLLILKGMVKLVTSKTILCQKIQKMDRVEVMSVVLRKNNLKCRPLFYIKRRLKIESNDGLFLPKGFPQTED